LFLLIVTGDHGSPLSASPSLWLSVADPGCLSRIPDHDFYPSRIPDPKTATEERSEKKFVVILFLCSHRFHKIVNYFSFEVLKKKIWTNFQRIIELPGVKKASDPGSATLLWLVSFNVELPFC
jgi:hypothetical protein